MWAFCSHGNLVKVLTNKNWVKFSKNWSANENRPAFAARKLRGVKHMLKISRWAARVWKDRRFKIRKGEEILWN